LKFEKRSQFSVGGDDESLSVVAVCVSNPNRSPIESTAETQPKLHPALLSLSATSSQDFTGRSLPFCSPQGNDKMIQTSAMPRATFTIRALVALLAPIAVGSVLSESPEAAKVRVTTWNLEWFPTVLRRMQRRKYKRNASRQRQTF
jgi:hypothetical protein